MFTLLHTGSRLFELFSKEVRVKKQPGMPFKRNNLHKERIPELLETNCKRCGDEKKLARVWSFDVTWHEQLNVETNSEYLGQYGCKVTVCR